MEEGRGFGQWSPRVSVPNTTLFLDSMSVPWCKALHLWPWGRPPQTGPQATSRKREEAGKAEYLPGSQLLWGQNTGTEPRAPQHMDLEVGQASWLSEPFTPLDSLGKAFWSSGPGMNQTKAR